jgi:hypothetical protein
LAKYEPKGRRNGASLYLFGLRKVMRSKKKGNKLHGKYFPVEVKKTGRAELSTEPTFNFTPPGGK